MWYKEHRGASMLPGKVVWHVACAAACPAVIMLGGLNSAFSLSILADDEQRKGTAAFLKEATKEVYGASGEAASLADRVGRRKHYAESRGDVAFRR